MSAKILVVDDEPDIRFLLKDILEDEGYRVDVAEHARAANEIRGKSLPDLVLLDIWMPEIDGVTLLKQWKDDGKDDCPVVMMSGHGTVETAVEATRYGAYDFVEKPLSMAKLLSTVKAALNSTGAPTETAPLKREQPVGNSQIVQALRKRFDALKDTQEPVFFSGTSGSGRRIWADYLSQLSNPSIPMRVFDQTMDTRRISSLKSNLYIEEISELSRIQQLQIADALNDAGEQNGFRIIASSRHNFEQLAGTDMVPELTERWRQAIHIPSLDEHIEDIPELLEYYVNWYGEQEQLPYRHFGVAVQNLLRNHPWPGDISQLKQFIKGVLGNSDSETVELDEVERLLRQSQADADSDSANALHLVIDPGMELREAREVFEREYLSHHLELCGHNITELARRVGQERTHLYRKLKSLGLYTKKKS